MNRKGIVTHTNHCVLRHKDGVVKAPDSLPDTRFRLTRINQLLNGANEEEPNAELAARLLKDEMKGGGAAIVCEGQSANPLFHCHGFREQESQGCRGAAREFH